MGDPHRETHRRWFWVTEDGALVQRSPQSILRSLERGERSLSDPIQVSPDREPQPIRLFLRQLVWMADADTAEATRASNEVVLSLKRQVFDNAPVGLVVADLNGCITEANATFAHIVGRSRSEVIGSLVGDLSEPEDHARERELGNQMIFGERSFIQIEKRFLKPDGSEVPCLMGLSLLQNDRGETRNVVGVVVDVSEQRQLEAIRSQVAQADATQRLARSVAHDLTNLMSVIHLATEMLEEEFGTSSTDVQDHLSAIRQAVNLALALSARLRNLSVIATNADQPLDVSEALRRMVPMLGKVVGTQRAFMDEIPTASAWVTLSTADLETILLNLLVNATEATGPSGTIRLRLTPGGSVHRLSVSDDGVGMSADVLARFREPEFTTKAEGSGLGMSIVTTALARLGGQLEVDSTEGEGTTITLVMPAVSGET
jgi:PAS domain S-box-containing protein